LTAVSASDTDSATQVEATSRELMPGGLALSGALHILAFLLILFGLPTLFRHPPPEETPIAVQLVTIAPETKATAPNPFRPKPEAKPEPPIAAPAPKPEPKPEPPPPAPEPSAATPAPPAVLPEPARAEPKPAPPPPPPKPLETQAPPPPPPRPPEPKPKPEPQLTRAAKPEKADPKKFDELLKTLEEKRPQPQPAAFDALLKNLTKQPTAPSDEPPIARPKIAAAALQSSQPKAPLGSQLTASELDALAAEVLRQLTPCWNIPAGARDARALVVEVKATVNTDGTVRQATVVDRGRMSDPLYRAAAESARRTFFNPQCTPLRLPPDKYEVWKDLVVEFNPKDLL
jgi:outer membrane biosynthesis protein TonB